MSKRTLKRQLNLFQVIMLGSAGAIGSGIFILTGLAVEISGPAAFIAILVGGFLSFSIALNYCELATIYPETGGAMTYVREAWGKGLLSFLIGSMDSISSTFYCALSAVGFAYSLSVFFPAVPIIPTAILVILIFVILNILGVANVGNAQIVMGVILIFAFGVYIIAGFILPGGFSTETFLSQGRLFPHQGFFENTSILMRTIALVYAIYIGFEVIADDAEEIKNPNRNIPAGIIISLVMITVLYTLTFIVTLGTTHWTTIAGSETALSFTVSKFLPGFGVSLIGFAGMVGSLTSINSSMLSATRETFTLSRDGAWPLALARLNKARVPYMAILMIGFVSIGIAIFGVVEFLSYITSAGYLFVLFFSNLAMIQIRKKFPSIHRPFKVPFYPLTPILASITCVIVILFSSLDAILFTSGVIALFAVYYFARAGLAMWQETHRRDLSPGRYRILLPLSSTRGADGIIKLASMLAEAEKDLSLCLLTVMPKTAQSDLQAPGEYLEKMTNLRHAILEKFVHYAVDRNVPMYTKMISDASLADGIINEIKHDNNVKLALMKWAERAPERENGYGAIKQVIEKGKVSIAVLRDNGLKKFENILVPVGGGLNSRMAVHIANDIAAQEGSNVDYIKVVPAEVDEETNEDLISNLQEVLLTEVGNIPVNASLQVAYAKEIEKAILEKCEANDYDLVIIGSADDAPNGTLFGKICETIANQAGHSVLVVRKYSSTSAAWLRHQAKRFQ